jgi:hypothetical protein
MFATLRKYEVQASFWNESEVLRSTGGLQERSDEAPVTLKSTFMHAGKEFIDEPEGRYNRDIYTFQISKKELYDNSFTIYEGRTFIEYNGDTYRVVRVHDYRDRWWIQLIECLCVRMIDVD